MGLLIARNVRILASAFVGAILGSLDTSQLNRTYTLLAGEDLGACTGKTPKIRRCRRMLWLLEPPLAPARKAGTLQPSLSNIFPVVWMVEQKGRALERSLSSSGTKGIYGNT